MSGLDVEGLNRVLDMFQDMDIEGVRQVVTHSDTDAFGTSATAKAGRKSFSEEASLQSKRTKLRQQLKSNDGSGLPASQLAGDELDDEIDWFKVFI